MRRSREPIVPEDYIFFVCERFLNQEGATNIANWLQSEGFTVSREQVYALVKQGVDLGYVKLCPPPDMILTQRLASVFPQAAADIQILQVDHATALEHLAMAGAEKALLLIKELGRQKNTVHIGLGAGHTTERFARNLALRLRAEPSDELPSMVIHALSSGFSPKKPTTAPIAFFSFFEWLGPKVQYIGLFSEPFVDWGQYRNVVKSPGVREAFEEAPKIDIVVSSLSTRTDEHGLFNEFLRMGSARGVKDLAKAGWVGDVQWRPYSDQGPLSDVNTGTRPVTLFELQDLVEMAKTPSKHVILIAGPCATCRQNKSRALLPLMQQHSLRVFNHLITDSTTAVALLNGSPE